MKSVHFRFQLQGWFHAEHRYQHGAPLRFFGDPSRMLLHESEHNSSACTASLVQKSSMALTFCWNPDHVQFFLFWGFDTANILVFLPQKQFDYSFDAVSALKHSRRGLFQGGKLAWKEAGPVSPARQGLGGLQQQGPASAVVHYPGHLLAPGDMDPSLMLMGVLSCLLR
ncbi:hypothetical protein ABBQ38_013280 [Trebouxia sp. C0009 RCD-2024]